MWFNIAPAARSGRRWRRAPPAKGWSYSTRSPPTPSTRRFEGHCLSVVLPLPSFSKAFSSSDDCHTRTMSKALHFRCLPPLKHCLSDVLPLPSSSQSALPSVPAQALYTRFDGTLWGTAGRPSSVRPCYHGKLVPLRHPMVKSYPLEPLRGYGFNVGFR